jgi:hypothetical protein
MISDFAGSIEKRTNTFPVIPLDSRGGSRDGHVAFTLLFPSSEPGERKLQVLSRITLTLQSSDQIESIDESVFRTIRANPSIDCFAIRPANDRQFIELLNNQAKYGYDLISIDLSMGHFFTQLGFLSRILKTSPVYVEVELGPIIRNTSGSELGNGINQSRMMLSNYKHMLVSSGAKNPFEIRSVTDVTNWAQGILGFKNVQKNISEFLEKILKKKFSRLSVSGGAKMDLDS